METRTRVHTELSDLFFNHQHPAREAYYRDTEPEDRDDGGESAALLKDAVEFCSNYEQTVGFFGGPAPADLADDFMARL